MSSLERVLNVEAYIRSFLLDHGFSNDASNSVLSTYASIKEKGLDEFFALLDLYAAKKENVKYDDVKELLGALYSKKAAHEYAVNLVLFIALSEQLKDIYKQKGLPEEMFFESMKDILYKANECHLVKGVWGNFVPTWEIAFFQLRLFGLGNIQVEIGPMNYDPSMVGIKQGTKVLFLHIPRTGHRLNVEETKKEMKFALSYFKDRIDRPAILCHSYLLHPINLELLPEKSNLRELISMFDIKYSSEVDGYSELWRLFDQEIDPENIDALPDDTSLRRNYIKAMKEGRKMGHGVGVIDLSK